MSVASVGASVSASVTAIKPKNQPVPSAAQQATASGARRPWVVFMILTPSASPGVAVYHGDIASR